MAEVTPAIFAVNNVDYSANVSQRSYKVQNAKEFAAWVDGNRITHRTVVRQKVAGSFTMTFLSSTDLSNFMSAVNTATTTDGYTAVKLWVSNESQVMSINAFLTITTKTVWTQDGNTTPAVYVVTVKVEQR